MRESTALRRHQSVYLPLRALIFGVLILLQATLPRMGSAQIIRDGTIGPPGGPQTLIGSDYRIDSTLGAIKSDNGTTNLFHSFSEFNVNLGESATFTNSLGVTINNILSRVTGNNPSTINGLLASEIPGANLYLLNPQGVIFGANASLDIGASIGQPGSLFVSTADYVKLSGDALFHTVPDIARDMLLSSAPVAAFGFLGPTFEEIRVEGSTLTLATGTDLSFIGGNISIGADAGSGTLAFISAPSGKINLVSVASPGEVLYPSLQNGSNINSQSFTAMGTVAISDFGTVDVSGSPVEGDGHAGSIRIRGGQFTLNNFSFLLASTQGNVAGNGPGVSVIVHEDAGSGVTGNVTLRNVSGIVTGTGSGTGADGSVEISAKNVLIADGSFILTGSSGPAPAGNITIQADTISLTGGLPDEGLITNITTLGDGSVEGGTISLSGRGSSGETLSISDQGQILTSSSSGRGGDVLIEMDHVTVSGGASLVTSSGSFASAGDILITAPESFSLTELSPGGAGSAITSISNLSPANISITTGQFLLDEGARIDGQTSAPQGGQIGISATGSITIQDNSFITSISNVGTGTALELYAPTILIDQSTLSARSAGTADGGTITVHATNDNLILNHGSVIASSTGGSGTGGSVEATASDSVVISGGSRIESNAFSTSSNNAGAVTVMAGNQVTLSGTGSGVFTETRSTGLGGNLSITAGQSVNLNNGAIVSANSTGTGNAGNITIDAGRQFEMRNSTIKTEASQASGGDIDIQAIEQILLVDGIISTSVLGGSGSGGNITIDPMVFVMQNSQIIAQAFQGAGGNITITTPLFLADSSSLVSASSQFGLNGTVTIQSPTSNLSGSLGPLASKTQQVQSLLTQRCAALANDQASSFVVAGREQLPSDPGGWLTSPLALAGLDTDPFNNKTVAKGTSNLEPRTSSLLANDRVSLRRLTPARFLIANFADSEATGCHS